MVASVQSRAIVGKLDKRLPTERQADIAASILLLKRTLGRTPSYREIGAACGIKSAHGVAQQLMALKRKGCVNWGAKLGRSLVVVSGILFLGDVQ
jgi:SOS-response transcriptional repressor LexA